MLMGMKDGEQDRSENFSSTWREAHHYETFRKGHLRAARIYLTQYWPRGCCTYSIDGFFDKDLHHVSYESLNRAINKSTASSYLFTHDSSCPYHPSGHQFLYLGSNPWVSHVFL